MKKIFFLSILFQAFILTAFSQSAYWQQQVNYKIQVRLNDSDNTLDGYEQIAYYNNSPDTLHFIWIHLWANAFKNDRTAYSDQLLENGRTDFYFSNEDKKGYINRLNFTVDGTVAETQDHPIHQDIIKLILPKPLAPGTSVNIETPFHIKLPYNFSGDGHTGHSYQITQWYPKPAVYDKYGWHEMPYLLQDGSYNERGNYEVNITVPKRYTVFINMRQLPRTRNQDSIPQSTAPNKTLTFVQDSLTDFVWIATKYPPTHIVVFPDPKAYQDSLDKIESMQQTTKRTKLIFLFNKKANNNYNTTYIGPAIGYNLYDGLMLGAFIHNYTLPPTKFQFFLSPMYATESKQLNGIGRMSYTIYPNDRDDKLILSLSGETFSEQSFTDSTGSTKYLRFSKIVPSIKYVFASNNPRSSITKFIQWKTFFIVEQGLLFTRDTVNLVDNITYPVSTHYINQLRFVINNSRVLYPYNGELNIEQGTQFIKAGFTGNYYFNYPKGGGLNVRLFAGKFFYLVDRTFLAQAQTDPYQLNMTGPKGYEDYTYSDYFIGRNSQDGISAQQLMMRDGFFKVGTDLFSNKVGKSDDWLTAVNFTTDIPQAINPLKILPVKIPLKAFFDIGTYAGAWQDGSSTGKFLYDAGLQLSLIKNIVNIYIPVFYSTVYHNYYSSVFPQNKFWKSVSFSIDIQNIKAGKHMAKMYQQF